MEFKDRFNDMLAQVGFSGVEPTLRYSSPSDLWVANMEFFDPILTELFVRDFVFSEERQAEIDRTLTEMLVNSRIACKEAPDKFVRLDSYIGDRGFVAHVSDDGRGFNSEKKIEERRKQLHLYDKARAVKDGYGIGNGRTQGGVGIYSLLTFADDFQYSRKGNEVVVRFDLSK